MFLTSNFRAQENLRGLCLVAASLNSRAKKNLMKQKLNRGLLLISVVAKLYPRPHLFLTDSDIDVRPRRFGQHLRQGAANFGECRSFFGIQAPASFHQSVEFVRAVSWLRHTIAA